MAFPLRHDGHVAFLATLMFCFVWVLLSLLNFSHCWVGNLGFVKSPSLMMYITMSNALVESLAVDVYDMFRSQGRFFSDRPLLCVWPPRKKMSLGIGSKMVRGKNKRLKYTKRFVYWVLRSPGLQKKTQNSSLWCHETKEFHRNLEVSEVSSPNSLDHPGGRFGSLAPRARRACLIAWEKRVTAEWLWCNSCVSWRWSSYTIEMIVSQALQKLVCCWTLKCFSEALWLLKASIAAIASQCFAAAQHTFRPCGRCQAVHPPYRKKRPFQKRPAVTWSATSGDL